MELRFNIDDKFINNMQQQLIGSSKPTEITREALTILNWAINEAANGRVIVSTTQDGKDIHRLVMPSLSRVRKI